MSLSAQESCHLQADSIILSRQVTLACRQFSRSKSLPKCAWPEELTVPIHLLISELSLQARAFEISAMQRAMKTAK